MAACIRLSSKNGAVWWGCRRSSGPSFRPLAQFLGYGANFALLRGKEWVVFVLSNSATPTHIQIDTRTGAGLWLGVYAGLCRGRHLHIVQDVSMCRTTATVDGGILKSANVSRLHTRVHALVNRTCTPTSCADVRAPVCVLCYWTEHRRCMRNGRALKARVPQSPAIFRDLVVLNLLDFTPIFISPSCGSDLLSSGRIHGYRMSNAASSIRVGRLLHSWWVA